MRWIKQHALALGIQDLVVFVVGVIVGGAILLTLHEQHWLGDKQPRKPAAFSEVAEPMAGALAERFRPWLRFDSQEHWTPLSISALFAERSGRVGAHQFCQTTSATTCVPIDSEGEFKHLADRAAALGGATHIDLAGNSLDGYHGSRRCGVLFDCGDGPASAIYYHVMQSNDRYYVDYWFFYRFNNFYRSDPAVTCRDATTRTGGVCDEHEGDWEGVTVVTPPGHDDRIDYVVYAAHKGTFRYSAKQLGFHGTRPDVYVARGSHASYPRSCAARCIQPIAAQGLVSLPEGTFDGRADWKRDAEPCKPNAPGSCLLSLPRTDSDPQAWTVWRGFWGAGCPDVCGGKPGPLSPRSPGLQARYQTPWCSTQGDVFTCDGLALGCSDWLGPLVSVVACDPDALSAGLRDPKKQATGSIAVTIQGTSRTHETTPGIVQALGDPLQPGQSVTVSGGGRGLQILLRARQGAYIAETRFADLHLGAGQSAVVSVLAGHTAPIIRLPGHTPIERRVIKVQATP